MIVDTGAREGECIWRPSDETVSTSNVSAFRKFLNERGVIVGDYTSLWHWSVEKPEEFWAAFADFARLRLGGVADDVMRGSTIRDTRWFPGRTVNFAEHLLGERQGVAVICRGESAESRREYSWRELRDSVAALADYLRRRGVGKGDVVVAVLPNIYESIVALLATASIGAVWSICAPEFGSGAITSRFAQLEPRILIAAPGYFLGGKDRDRRVDLEEIITSIPSLEEVVWVTTSTDVPVPHLEKPSIPWAEATRHAAELTFTEMEFNEPLWVLFSSGTTGIPKGIVHSHGGALIELMKMLLLQSELRPGDRYFSVASTSWVVWNALVSSLGVGAVPVLLDGNPTYPSVDNVWRVAAEEGVSVLGLSAGFVHACLKEKLVPRESHDLKNLRCVQVTGSPLSPDGYRWIYQSVGDVWLSSMSGGTDIASIFVGGSITLPVNVGYIQAPALGARVECWDENGKPSSGKGEMVVTLPMPSMPLYLWGDTDGSRLYGSYFDMYPEIWRHGDYIEFASSGILIHGRSDSTLNRNGIRLGSADIYAVVEAIPAVAESLIVGAELGTEYYMPLFVALAPGADADQAISDIDAAIRKNLSVRYLPDDIIVMPGIPHTRTGKKLEVPIKRLLQGDSIDAVVDPQAIDNPDLLVEYAALATTKRRQLAAS